MWSWYICGSRPNNQTDSRNILGVVSLHALALGVLGHIADGDEAGTKARESVDHSKTMQARK